MQGVRVQSLIRELRSHMLHGGQIFFFYCDYLWILWLRFEASHPTPWPGRSGSLWVLVHSHRKANISKISFSKYPCLGSPLSSGSSLPPPPNSPSVPHTYCWNIYSLSSLDPSPNVELDSCSKLTIKGTPIVTNPHIRLPVGSLHH